MTREQAINYLIDTGMSPEQVMEIVEALKAEPCEDCIRRKDAISTVNHIYNSCRECTLEEYRDTLIESFNVLCGVHSARKTGKWIVHRGNYNEFYECSGCHKQNREGGAFCNFCGAKMEDGE